MLSVSVIVAVTLLNSPSSCAFVLPRQLQQSKQSIYPFHSPDATIASRTTVTAILSSAQDEDAQAAKSPSPPPDEDDERFGQDEEGRLRIVVEQEVTKPKPPPPPTSMTPPSSSPLSSSPALSPKKRELTTEEKKLAAAAGVGGILVGAALGGIVDLQNPDIDLYVSPLVPPVIGAVSLSAFGFIAGSSDSPAGGFARYVLGRSTVVTGNAIAAGVEGAVDSAVSAAKNKVKQTTDDIKAIPSNIQKAAVAKAQETKEEIISIPGKLQTAAVETATEIADEIKATPGRIVESTKKAVEDAVDDTLDAVEEFVEDVKAIPQKAIDNVEESISSILGTTPQLPRPPLAPPKADISNDKKPPAPPKVIPAPTSNDRKLLIPKINSIKIDLQNVPKVSLPSVPAAFKEDPAKAQRRLPATKTETDSSPSNSFLDRVTVKSFNKDISFDEKTGRFFETGPAPKIETPNFKVGVPVVKLPIIDLPTPGVSTKDVEPTSQDEPKVQTEKKRNSKQAAELRASELKREQENFARAEAARLRKQEDERKRAEVVEAKRQQVLEVKRKADEARINSEARKRALEQSRKEKLEAQAKEFEEKRRRMEEQRRSREEKLKQQQEVAKGAALKAKRQQAAERSLEQAKSRKTMSLGSLFGFGSDDGPNQESYPVPKKENAKAPSGVPVISFWRQNNDGSITGKISGSSMFTDGEVVTTSPIQKGAKPSSVVKTSSGSSYFLEQKAPVSFGFNFLGSADQTEPATVNREKTAVDEKKGEASAAAKRREQEAEAKRLAAAEAAERKKREADDRKAAALAAAEERKQAAKAAAEERKAALAAAAEERKRVAEEERLKAEIAKRALEEKKKAAQERRAVASNAVAGNISKATVIPETEKPPQGIPVIKSWKQRPDGGVSGRIYASPNFTDGDFVETSRIFKGKIENGSVVSTESGSRYFLSAEIAVKTGGFLSAIKDLAGAEPGATITLTRERKERDAKAAEEAIQKAKPRSTFSVFGLGDNSSDEADRGPLLAVPKKPAAKFSPERGVADKTPAKKKAPPKKPLPLPTATAPRGVPTLKKWKKNRDGSVTGIITGSNSFPDGERVTTSAIKQGNCAKNEVVVTGSGSKYFLS